MSSLVYLHCQRHYSYALGPLVCEIRIECMRQDTGATVGLIIEMAVGSRQTHWTRSDSCLKQNRARKKWLNCATQNSLQLCMDCVLLEFYI